jgi:uncharacterized membrane protein
MSFIEAFEVYVLHWVPEKAIYIGGHTLPWDARCSGIYVGIGFGLVWMFLTGRESGRLPKFPILCMNTAMCLPLFIDVASIWLKARAPSNEIRYLTGCMFGSSLTVYMYPTFISLLLKNFHCRAAIDSYSKYGLFLLLLMSVFLLKNLNNTFAFWIASALSIFGFTGIYAILSANVFLLLTRSHRDTLD